MLADLETIRDRMIANLAHVNALIDVWKNANATADAKSVSELGGCKHERREAISGFGVRTGMYKCMEPGCGQEFTV